MEEDQTGWTCCLAAAYRVAKTLRMCTCTRHLKHKFVHIFMSAQASVAFLQGCTRDCNGSFLSVRKNIVRSAVVSFCAKAIVLKPSSVLWRCVQQGSSGILADKVWHTHTFSIM